jgi:hypothetical protein
LTSSTVVEAPSIALGAWCRTVFACWDQITPTTARVTTREIIPKSFSTCSDIGIGREGLNNVC